MRAANSRTIGPTQQVSFTSEGVRKFRTTVYDENNHVCWGPLQTRKDARRTLRPLYLVSGHFFFFFFFFFSAAPVGLLKTRRTSANRPEQTHALALHQRGTTDSLEFSPLRKSGKPNYGHLRCVGHLKRSPLKPLARRQEQPPLPDTKTGNPAKCPFGHAGDSRSPLQRLLLVEPEDPDVVEPVSREQSRTYVYLVSGHRSSKPEYDWNFQFLTGHKTRSPGP